jgi:MurNAc alpha-1-phosphate uridylyltransferase
MILAAGRGERMRPLTEHTPKPLLEVAGEPLIARHIRRLAAAGVGQLVINVSHLAEQIESYCGDGSRWGVEIAWSRESQPLETAGGIVRALPLLGDAPFLVVNGDIWTDYDFADLVNPGNCAEGQAQLVMVANPPQHPLGDFLLKDGRLAHRSDAEAGLTYAGIGLYSRAFFSGSDDSVAPLRPLLDRAIADGRLLGLRYPGRWEDVGTPERLRALNLSLAASDQAPAVMPLGPRPR